MRALCKMGTSTADKQMEAQKLADRLLGTPDLAPDYLYDDPDLCAFLDDLIVICNGCDQWVEAHELDDYGLCEDCQ